MFKRRDKRSYLALLGDAFYPKGGWRRAASYVMHRLRRLPDPPHRIARGIFAGVFVSFTPFFGLHFIGAGLIAFVMRGNIIAALLATFFGNPLTTPFIMTASVGLGNWMLGHPPGMQLPQIVAAFAGAGSELWHNFTAIFSGDLAHWAELHRFFHRVFWPYMVGGIVPGVVAGLVCYYLCLPAVGAYQALRQKQAADRQKKRSAQRAREAAALGQIMVPGKAPLIGPLGPEQV